MTRKDYVAIAAELKEERDEEFDPQTATRVEWAAEDTRQSLALRIAALCERDNPRFDRDRFMIAAGVPRA